MLRVELQWIKLIIQMKKIIAFEWLSLDGLIGGQMKRQIGLFGMRKLKNLQKNIKLKLILCYLAELLTK